MSARRVFVLAATLLAVAGCGALAAVVKGGDDCVVPDLIGRTREEAVALVMAAGFTQGPESSRPVECEDAEHVEGRINCQAPPAGKIVKKYTAVQINVYHKTRIAGAIVREQLLSLIGMTPADAREALKSFGHDGTVEVSPGSRFWDKCGKERVCAFDQPESGMGVHDPIILYVNPGLKIAAPPK